MPINVGTRPAGLDGCWRTWVEQDVDVVARTEFESGNMRTRRRFTGINRMVEASVILTIDKYNDFQTWFRVNQRQGAIGAQVKTPYGTEETFQFTAPPKYSFNINGTVTVAVTLFQGSDF